MNHCEDIIEYIKRIKENLYNDIYHSGEDLGRDFSKINELTGIKTNTMEYENLNEAFAVQEFLIDEVCKIHESENDLVNEKLLSKSINIKELNEHLNDGKRAFKIYSFNESGYDYFLIGDIHSDTVSLKRILQICDFFSNVVEKKKERLIFLGDYVDRGKAHIKTLEYILALKFIFPDHVYLLRGNHDDGVLMGDRIKLCVGKPDDERDEDYFLLYLDNILKNDDELRLRIINSYLNFFNSLCNIAFINNQTVSLMAVHGGIPRPRKNDLKYYSYIHSISDLTNAQIIDTMNKTICNNMLWSDPCNGEEDLRESSGRFRFTAEHFDEFQSDIKFDLLIRGHEAEEEGYKNFFDDRLITIFSSGAILENNININDETAYEDVTPKIIKFSKSGQVSLLGLSG
ncbi:metallophosphoesterase family protein [Lutispora saccharofermentans]|uniref:Serine/threonine protein phosphatase n=1 Tax=Lutispora saccharofermentans TaxID=3024236 RepID=A0ABT1NJD1_9FIRM|nr:serine/threonine protein phosphatase [Lutispora saccharofermentans]